MRTIQKLMGHKHIGSDESEDALRTAVELV
jgi:hypothetical protein